MLEVIKVDTKHLVHFKNVRRLNCKNSEKVKKQLSPFVEKQNSELTINLEGINFIDSSGFVTLISLLNTANKNNCKLEISNVNSEVLELFELLKLNDIFSLNQN
ncbi:MAG: STAS domain-containing protein [Bacteroidales bacterium]|nr:STAS domain-containing protein [Bacteroidales bacterium]